MRKFLKYRCLHCALQFIRIISDFAYDVWQIVRITARFKHQTIKVFLLLIRKKTAEALFETTELPISKWKFKVRNPNEKVTDSSRSTLGYTIMNNTNLLSGRT